MSNIEFQREGGPTGNLLRSQNVVLHMGQIGITRFFIGLKRGADRNVRLFTLPIVAIAISLAAIVLTPQAIGWAAGRPPANFDPYTVNKPRALVFLDAEGGLLGRRGAIVGERISLAAMPTYLPAAFLAMEDHRFYSHHGLDFIGIVNAAYKDWRAHKYVAGGSTITQQTAKLLFDRREKTLSRKLTEIKNAAWVEHNYSKDQILSLYLNRIYLGDGNYGVDAAARDYFGVSARELSLPQAAMLAAITRAPAVYGPRHDLERAQRRASMVLQAMAGQGFITPATAQEAMRNPAALIRGSNRVLSNYVLDAAMAEATAILDERPAPEGELIVHTTVEAPAQSASEAIARDAVAAYGAKRHVSQAAILVMKPEGGISAMVGGIDYSRSVFNRATQAHRQPGSAFKPFVYLAALQGGHSPWEWREDRAVDIDGYQPSNYKQEQYGNIRLIDALAHSVNTVTVNLAQEVGLGNVIAAARQAGITSPLGYNASLPLGTNEVTPVELTAAYAYFANGGERVSPYLVSRIESAVTGETVYKRMFAEHSAFTNLSVSKDMVAMLYDVVLRGTGTAARLADREAAGKTGTTQDYRDAWFAGFTADYVAGIWIGNDDNSPMRNVTGGTIPASMWKRLMTALERGHPPRPLDRTPGPPPGLDAEPEDPAAIADSDEFPSVAKEDENWLLASGITEERPVPPEASQPETVESAVVRPEPPALLPKPLAELPQQKPPEHLSDAPPFGSNNR